ncbi:hypothetical protein [Streptomyces sp. AP-93]|uniref:hypothetical protein n=1 Tax=Streptomyces sp. AP-93 TaxID=2929048 RepID=UPI001FAF8449|nr:hypothetical protein [Streptomyces sp. AP-93]MCJ0874245.1 hypothetical protein [Streptomyces sp. AP-93]
MTTTEPPVTGTAPGPGSDGRLDTAGGGIERLNAFDGLFLRAEHLNRIQDHTEAHARALGEAGGPGVVEGFAVELEDGALHVGAGLAVTADGIALRSGRLTSLPLPADNFREDGFWWVEAVPATWQYGEAPVQGAYCDDPCSGSGTVRRPYEVEGVRIRLVQALAEGLGGKSAKHRRNFLANWYFRAERLAADPWPYRSDAPDLPRHWEPPGVAGRPAGVRLAALIRHCEGAWETDTWTARRDRGAPPPERYWQMRLGMRPWDVFMAQILQFQAQLADVTGKPGVPEGALGPLVHKLLSFGGQDYLKRHTKLEVGKDLTELAEGVRTGRYSPPTRPGKGVHALRDLGFDELPPAGYLPVEYGDLTQWLEELRDRMSTYLGDAVELRYCAVTVADVAQAVEEARHRDRIRIKLDERVRERVPVDILVPLGPHYEPVTRWVAFVRRDQRRCIEEQWKSQQDTREQDADQTPDIALGDASVT